MRKMIFMWLTLLLLTLTLFGCGLFDSNEAPVIDKIEMSKTKAKLGDEVILNVMANDPDGDELTYKYEVSIGSITGSGGMVSWKIEKPIEFVIMDGSEPEVEEEESVHFAKVTVSDGDKSVQESVSITVVPKEEAAPCVFDIKIITGGSSPSNVLWGIVWVEKDGSPLDGVTVKFENKTTDESGVATTTGSGTVDFNSDPGGLPDLMAGNIVKVTVSYGGDSCEGCYEVENFTNQDPWTKIPCQ